MVLELDSQGPPGRLGGLDHIGLEPLGPGPVHAHAHIHADTHGRSHGPSTLTLRWGADPLSCPPALARLGLSDTPLVRVNPASVLRPTPQKQPHPHREHGGAQECRSGPTGPIVALAAADYILSGRVWTAFRRGRTVVKVHVPAPGDMGALEEAAVEGWIYEHRLACAGLLGDAVPRWHGMYASRGRGKGAPRVVAAALEDVGEPMGPEAVAALTPAERGSILAKYARLHAAGVVHGSAKPKHWLRVAGAPVNEIRIIDFGAARILDAEDVPPEMGREWCVLGQEEFTRAVWDEYAELLRALGL